MEKWIRYYAKKEFSKSIKIPELLGYITLAILGIGIYYIATFQVSISIPCEWESPFKVRVSNEYPIALKRGEKITFEQGKIKINTSIRNVDHTSKGTLLEVEDTLKEDQKLRINLASKPLSDLLFKKKDSL